MVNVTRNPVRARIHRLPFPPYSGPPIRRWVYEVSVEGSARTVTGAYMTWEEAQREVDRLVRDPALLRARLNAGWYVTHGGVDPSVLPTVRALLDVRDHLRKSGSTDADEVGNAIHRIAFPQER